VSVEKAAADLEKKEADTWAEAPEEPQVWPHPARCVRPRSPRVARSASRFGARFRPACEPLLRGQRRPQTISGLSSLPSMMNILPTS
jgi:hypothetical protein